ncbi:MAG: hypothetical protein JJLCMIEE_01212 [Acidimicrobiales bacterium]|nr:MAG: NAD(P)-dependent oxidoreductase [Actinomycetota bacterium]MBV6508152.1 hypothetical protein [Acidimicrobiales bacterium]RIK08192.1 MAG: epimerase [Acidobacteriota bacterium]
MKIFVAGATGVLGRRAVARLVAAGHDVSGVARTPEKAELLRGIGAEPMTVDLFDAVSVKEAVAGHKAVCNLATNIPPLNKGFRKEAWQTNDRLRIEGSANLVDGAIAAGAELYLQESITFPYADGGDAWITEDDERDYGTAMLSNKEAERQALRFTEAGGRGVVLRFAMFYSPDSSHSRSFVDMVKRGVSPLIGRSSGYASFVHADDAAGAVVAGLDVPAGIYNVAEDNPTRKRDVAEKMAQLQRVKPPRFLPRWGLTLGGSGVRNLMRSQRIANRRFKELTGWRPLHGSIAEGWADILAELES